MIVSIIYFILILGLIVLVHEFGHFIFAKIFHVHVYEFAIGMGPKIWSSEKLQKNRRKKGKKVSETLYTIRAIPIGGFNQLAGEGLEEDKNIKKENLLTGRPIWQRFLILFFGAGNNFILAFVVLLLSAFIFGSPDISTKVPKVIEGSPMALAGIKNGDYIISINDKKTKTLDDVQLYLVIAGESETKFTVSRDGKEYNYNIAPLTGDAKKEAGYSFGIQYNNTLERGFIRSFKYASLKFYSITRQIFITIKELFTGGVSVGELSGPVGIYSAVDQTRSAGFYSVMNLIALLSLNVGIMNLLPFPAFDGGRLLFLIVEKIKGKPVKPETENFIHSIGFFILLGLIIYVTINDIIRLF
ncbi:MAG: RIP metalloprotease RseP [Bacilli bacterium]|nr:RIP metalloprotease RseP [Bacilli bacterium]